MSRGATEQETVLQELEGRFRYRGSWRETYLTSTGLAAADKQRFMSLRVQNLFSDLLFQPWYCATVPISLEWLERDTLERRSHLSAEDFRRLFELPNKPVVITDQVSAVLRTWGAGSSTQVAWCLLIAEAVWSPLSTIHTKQCVAG